MQPQHKLNELNWRYCASRRQIASNVSRGKRVHPASVVNIYLQLATARISQIFDYFITHLISGHVRAWLPHDSLFAWCAFSTSNCPAFYTSLPAQLKYNYQLRLYFLQCFWDYNQNKINLCNSYDMASIATVINGLRPTQQQLLLQ